MQSVRCELLGTGFVEKEGDRAGCTCRVSMPWEKTKAANTGQNDYCAYVADNCKLFPWHKWAG
eukprot:3186369-Pleurochrysis_carterae.AAC.1